MVGEIIVRQDIREACPDDVCRIPLLLDPEPALPRRHELDPRTIGLHGTYAHAPSNDAGTFRGGVG